MNEKVAIILQQAWKLTPEEHDALIQALQQDEDCDFSAPETERAWVKEAERRIDSIDRGEMTVRDITEVTYESLVK